MAGPPTRAGPVVVPTEGATLGTAAGEALGVTEGAALGVVGGGATGSGGGGPPYFGLQLTAAASAIPPNTSAAREETAPLGARAPGGVVRPSAPQKGHTSSVMRR